MSNTWFAARGYFHGFLTFSTETGIAEAYLTKAYLNGKTKTDSGATKVDPMWPPRLLPKAASTTFQERNELRLYIRSIQ